MYLINSNEDLIACHIFSVCILSFFGHLKVSPYIGISTHCSYYIWEWEFSKHIDFTISAF